MRPDKDTYFLQMAQLVASRSTCLRRAVGCVLIDHRGHVLATGYNGVPSGFPHCNAVDPFEPAGYPHACDGAHALSGAQLDTCHAVHAEQNALLQCRDTYAIDTAYCTTEPCVTCTKLLLNTSCKRVIYIDPYASSGQKIWLSKNNVATWLKKCVQADKTIVG